MSKLLKISLLGICLSLSSIALAVDNAKLAFVNIQTLREKATVSVSIDEQIKKKLEASRTDAISKEKDMQKKFSDLEAKKKVLSKTAFDAETAKLVKEAEEMTKKAAQERNQMEKAYFEGINAFQDKFVEIIQEKAKKDGLQAVFTTMQTAYYDPSLDITDSVMESINKALPSYTLNFDQK